MPGIPGPCRKVASLAAEYQIRIGAHPSYPDREHFGRVSMAMEKKEFQASIRPKLTDFLQVLASLNLSMHHIKAHGALYNDLARGGRMALEYLEVLQPYREKYILYAPCGSEFARMAAEQGSPFGKRLLPTGLMTPVEVWSRGLNPVQSLPTRRPWPNKFWKWSAGIA